MNIKRMVSIIITEDSQAATAMRAKLRAELARMVLMSKRADTKFKKQEFHDTANKINRVLRRTRVPKNRGRF